MAGLLPGPREEEESPEYRLVDKSRNTSYEGGDFDKIAGELSELSKTVTTIDMKKIHEIIALKKEISVLEAKLEPMKKMYELKRQLLLKQMQGAGTRQIKPEGTSACIFTTKRTYYKASNADKLKFARDFGKMALLTIPSDTFNKECDALVKSGVPLPKYIEKSESSSITIRGV